MTGDFITKHSFMFGQTDMWRAFGIRIADDGIAEDALFPPLRSRKITIPGRSGAFDFGAKFYDERNLTLRCVNLTAGDDALARTRAREIAFVLSQKGEIRLWNEPERFYVGRAYNAPGLEQLRRVGTEFSLTFVCEPYAYGATHTENFADGVFEKAYEGTAPTPTLITIRNLGTEAMTGIVIKQTDLRG